MNWQTFLMLCLQFFHDGRVLAILGLVLLDVLLGIAAAIRQGEFDWKKVGNFYRTAVVPNILGYLAFYLAGKIVGGSNALGPAGFLVSESVLWIVWVALITPLMASIIENGKRLGYMLPPEEPPA